MKKFDPNDKHDVEYVAEISAEPWMLAALELNPSYSGWAPGDDYMLGSQLQGGWAHAIKVNGWRDFTIEVGELNVFPDFYFAIGVDETPCRACDRTGRSEVARLILQSLVRLSDLSPEERQAAMTADGTREGDVVIHHPGRDAVARMRCGSNFECPTCKGSAATFSDTRLQLVLWLLHPRVGASRGVTVDRIEQHEIKEVCAFLRKAAEANTQRFTRAIAFSYAGSLCDHEDCASHDDMLIACGKSRAQIEAP